MNALWVCKLLDGTTKIQRVVWSWLKLLGRPRWQDLGPLRPIQHLGNILYRKSLVLKTNAAPHLVEKLLIAGTVLWNRIYWKHIKIARQDAILIITREMLEYSNLRKFVLRVQPLSYGWLMVLLANLKTAAVYLDYKNLHFREKSATILQNSAMPTFTCEKICIDVHNWIPDWHPFLVQGSSEFDQKMLDKKIKNWSRLIKISK